MKFMLAFALIGAFSTQSLAYYVGGKFNCENDLMGTAKVEISQDLSAVVFKAPRHQAVSLKCAPVYRSKFYQQDIRENIACKSPGTSKQDNPDLVLSRSVSQDDYTYFSAYAGAGLAQLENSVAGKVTFQCDAK